MNFRQCKINKTGKLYKSVKRFHHLVRLGNVLVIDPSIGSSSSMPGYCIARGGEVVETGTLAINPSGGTYGRLFEIGTTLRTEFSGVWDVLVIEAIPHKRWNVGRGGRKFGSVNQQVSLHRAVGAVLASVHASHCVMVSPSTWHTVAPENYEKSDEADAYVMFETVRQYAEAAANAVPKRKARKGLDKDGFPKQPKKPRAKKQKLLCPLSSPLT